MLINKNNQTTSTKCQYQAADSKPTWCSVVKWLKYNRTKQTEINKVPIKTWKPWKPVAIKKVDPYTLSLIVKGEVAYSKPWKLVKINAKAIVANKAKIAWPFDPPIIASWATVIVAPEVNKITVFKKRNFKSF